MHVNAVSVMMKETTGLLTFTGYTELFIQIRSPDEKWILLFSLETRLLSLVNGIANNFNLDTDNSTIPP